MPEARAGGHRLRCGEAALPQVTKIWGLGQKVRESVGAAGTEDPPGLDVGGQEGLGGRQEATEVGGSRMSGDLVN